MIYFIGLIFIIFVIIFSFDDFIWDFFIIFKRKNIDKNNKIFYEEIEKEIPGLIALIIPAYKEQAVLEKVILNFIHSTEYHKDMLHIFLGVYPNDSATLSIAQKLSAEFKNVHDVIHYLNGPSSKADNINNVINNIIDFEKKRKVQFKGIIIHDSEDVIHPYELLVINYLFNSHKAIQVPVFPFQFKPTLNNIFKNMVLGTYADEFAENHYNMMVIRNLINAFVPSAGTGFAIRRDVLELFSNNNLFTVGCLTEDYKLSLDLKIKNIQVHYFLEDVERLRNDGTAIKEFIATRSIFPATYRTAVKQKTRWIYGITMQSFKLREIIKDKNLSILTKLSIYKDWKTKFSNILIIPGYVIFTYFLLSLFFPIPTMFPINSLSWYLSILLTIMMIERQVFRFISVNKVYGVRSAFISSFLPPILPFRVVIGNIINFKATINAWRKHFNERLGIFKAFSNKPKWAKTDHEFLDKEVLINFKRKLGDVLLEKKLINTLQLQYALEESKIKDKKLGEILITNKFIIEKDLLIALSQINNMLYVDLIPEMILFDDITKYNLDLLMKNYVAPVMLNNDVFIFATSEIDGYEILTKKLKEELSINQEIKYIYTTKDSISEAYKEILENKNNAKKENIYKKIQYLRKLVEDNKIDINVASLALKFVSREISIDEILSRMGFIIDETSNR